MSTIRLALTITACLAIIPTANAQQITINYPNGGEVWQTGTTQYIEIGHDCSTIGFALYKNNQFLTDMRILGNDDSSHYYDWAICEDIPAGNDYTILATCYDETGTAVAQDFSDAPFEIEADPIPTLTVAHPNGGEQFNAGQPINIVWRADKPSGDILIWLYKNGQKQQMLSRATMAERMFIWDTPPHLDPADDYSIEIEWLSLCPLNIKDASDSTFSIANASPLPTMTITSPTTPIEWYGDTVQTITWDTTDPTGNVEIWFTDSIFGDPYSGPGNLFELLGIAPMANGRFDWPISPCLHADELTEYSIILRWTDGQQVVEATTPAPIIFWDMWWYISTQYMRFLSPTTDDSWQTGSTHTIAWETIVSYPTVRLYLCKNNAQVMKIGETIASDSAFDWTVPIGLEQDSDYSIRFIIAECGFSRDSEQFEITAATPTTLQLTSPTGTESWPAGTKQLITWDTNIAGSVDIYLPDSNDKYWGRQSVPATDGQYLWHIPANLPPGSNYEVEIRSFGAGPDFDRDALSTNGVTITEPTTTFGDSDVDGDVDLWDLFTFQGCYSGRGPAHLERPCNIFDYDLDDDVDDDDYFQFLALFYNVPVGNGDADLTGQVDLNDFAIFADCANDPGCLPTPFNTTTRKICLWSFDADADNDIDLRDFAEFQSVINNAKGNKP